MYKALNELQTRKNKRNRIVALKHPLEDRICNDDHECVTAIKEFFVSLQESLFPSQPESESVCVMPSPVSNSLSSPLNNAINTSSNNLSNIYNKDVNLNVNCQFNFNFNHNCMSNFLNTSSSSSNNCHEIKANNVLCQSLSISLPLVITSSSSVLSLSSSSSSLSSSSNRQLPSNIFSNTFDSFISSTNHNENRCINIDNDHNHNHNHSHNQMQSPNNIIEQYN